MIGAEAALTLHIAIDASRTTVTPLTGTERYALHMIQALLRLNTRHHITLYFRNAPPLDWFPSADVRVIPFRRAWTHLRFAAALFGDNPDMVWVPAHTLPFILPTNIRAAVTIHDLGYKHFPAAHPARQRLYLDLTTRTSAARADIIFADSSATAADLTRFYGTSPEKIEVVYPGVDPLPVGDIEAMRRKYQLPERYFLFVGTLQPRKNIARLVQAYQRWKTTSGDTQTALVLAGGRGWLYDPAWIADAENVILPGYIEDADKGALYAGALALVFPSLYEGFGFPVLEAMGCGTPVICSRTSSLPELANSAALLIDPLDVDRIADAMERISDDAALRDDLREWGRVNAARFTWDRAARQILNAMDV